MKVRRGDYTEERRGNLAQALIGFRRCYFDLREILGFHTQQATARTIRQHRTEHGR